MRRVQLASLLGFVVDTALLVLLMVTAFTAAGPVGVAGIGVARMLTSMSRGTGGRPAGALARRSSGRRTRHRARARCPGGDFLVILPAPLLSCCSRSPQRRERRMASLRPAQSTLLPALARTPAELVSANVASSTAEAMGSLRGPDDRGRVHRDWRATPLAGVIVLVAQAFGIVVAVRDPLRGPGRRARAEPSASGRGLAIAAGFAAIRRRPAIGVVIVGFGLQTLVRGLLDDAHRGAERRS